MMLCSLSCVHSAIPERYCVGTRSASVEELQKKKANQRLGARLYALYLVVYGGLMVVSMMDLIPAFEWEINGFEWHNDLANELRRSMHVPFALSFLYLVVIFGIQAIMANREPFNLRNELALWSLFLGVFSLFGSLRTVPVLLKGLVDHGLQHMVCADTREVWFYTPAGFWTGIFILSKVPELIDTLFIVLRKRKLITLHWYHHITVMTFCWHSWATLSLNGLFFSALNLTVHAFMYIFYSLTALGYRPTFFAQFITLAQIAQMVVGTAISCYVVFYRVMIDNDIDIDNLSYPNFNISVDKDTSPGCKINGVNAMAGMIMYGSYLWLFCVFYYYAYILPKPKSGKAKRSKDKDA